MCMLSDIPAQSRHGLNTVEQRRIMTRVFIALIVPGGDAVHAGIRLQQRHQLTEVGEKVQGHIQVFFNDYHVVCTLLGVREKRRKSER